MIALTAAAVAVGAVLVGAVGWDIALTVLHPGARGLVSYRANRAAWALVRAMSVRLDSRRLLSFAGPLAMGVNVVLWVSVLWLGFALVYLPFEAAYDALHISGQPLTTVGFGDIVAESDALRAISAFESGAGLGAFTAAIAHVLSVYPLVTAIRSNALHVADLGIDGPEGATRVIATGRLGRARRPAARDDREPRAPLPLSDPLLLRIGRRERVAEPSAARGMRHVPRSALGNRFCPRACRARPPSSAETASSAA